MLVGQTLEGINGKVLGNEFTAFTVPAVISPFLICEDRAAGRAEKLRWLIISLLIHHDSSFYHFGTPKHSSQTVSSYADGPQIVKRTFITPWFRLAISLPHRHKKSMVLVEESEILSQGCVKEVLEFFIGFVMIHNPMS